MGDVDPFLKEAQRRGLVTAAQAEDCLRIASTLAEVKVELTIDEIAARKGFVTAEQGAEIRRALARLRVGRYEVVDLLGEGAAGVVWRAHDTKLDRVVALKVLSRRAQELPAFRERFAREARIAVTLNHVNIVHGLDYGEADGYQYFAMEFVEGENAEKRLARVGRFPEREAVAIAADAVRALSYVQKFHIVHHDIKPSNLLLSPNGQAKLCDLGLAKPMLAESELMGGDGTTAGTPSYMSPEQIKHPEKMDWRGDVYSLGATLYHLLTGEPPFKAGTRSAVLDKHLHVPPASPREHVLELSDGVAAVVLRMLQKAPDERYASLDDLAADLESVLAGREPRHANRTTSPAAVTAERHAHTGAAHRIGESARSKSRFPWAAVAIFAAIAGAVVAVAMNVSAEKPTPSPASTQNVAPTALPAGNSAKQPAVEPSKTPAPEPVANPVATPRRDPALEARAATALEERTKRAMAHAQEGRFAAARAELDPFPAEFSGTASAKAVAEALDRIDGVARSRFDEIAKQADKAAARHRFDDAKTMLDEAAKIDAPWARDKANAARTEIEALAGKYEKSREEQAEPFADLYGRAILAAAASGVDSARALVDHPPGPLDAYDAEISSLREDLDVLEKNGVDPDAIEASGTRGATALLLARLAKGDVDAAEAGVPDGFGSSGGEASEARARIACVRRLIARQAEAKLDEAETALAGKNTVIAARRVEEALALSPTFVRARVMLGRVRLATNDVESALRVLGDVASRRDAPPDAHLWMGRALKAKGDEPARAETEIERFLAAAPAADASRSAAETELKDMRARRIDADVRRWRDVAKSAAKKGETARVEGAWGRVAELLKDDDPEALLQLGQIYLDKKLAAPAFVALSRVKQVPASDAQKKQAEKMLAKMKGTGLPTDDGQEFSAVADKYFDCENWDKAIQHYQAALMVSPHFSVARTKQIRAFLARCREKGAADDARAAVDAATTLASLFPDEAPPYALRSDAYLLLGDAKRAFDDATNAVKVDAKCGAAQLALGRAFIKAGEFAKAKDAFVAANRCDPSPEALIGVARCSEKTEDFDSARKALDDLKERFGIPPALFAEYQELTRGLPIDK